MKPTVQKLREREREREEAKTKELAESEANPSLIIYKATGIDTTIPSIKQKIKSARDNINTHLKNPHNPASKDIIQGSINELNAITNTITELYIKAPQHNWLRTLSATLHKQTYAVIEAGSSTIEQQKQAIGFKFSYAYRGLAAKVLADFYSHPMVLATSFPSIEAIMAITQRQHIYSTMAKSSWEIAGYFDPDLPEIGDALAALGQAPTNTHTPAPAPPSIQGLDIDQLIKNGTEAFRKGEFTQGQEAYNAACNLQPENKRAQFGRVYMEAHEGKPSALTEYNALESSLTNNQKKLWQALQQQQQAERKAAAKEEARKKEAAETKDRENKANKKAAERTKEEAQKKAAAEATAKEEAARREAAAKAAANVSLLPATQEITEDEAKKFTPVHSKKEAKKTITPTNGHKPQVSSSAKSGDKHLNHNRKKPNLDAHAGQKPAPATIVNQANIAPTPSYTFEVENFPPLALLKQPASAPVEVSSPISEPVIVNTVTAAEVEKITAVPASTAEKQEAPLLVTGNTPPLQPVVNQFLPPYNPILHTESIRARLTFLPKEKGTLSHAERQAIYASGLNQLRMAGQNDVLFLLSSYDLIASKALNADERSFFNTRVFTSEAALPFIWGNPFQQPSQADWRAMIPLANPDRTDTFDFAKIFLLPKLGQMDAKERTKLLGHTGNEIYKKAISHLGREKSNAPQIA